MGLFGMQSDQFSAREDPGVLPRSTLLLGVVAAVVFTVVGVIACSWNGSQPLPVQPPLVVRPTAEPDIRVRVREGATLVTISGPSLISLRWDGPGTGIDSIATPVSVALSDEGSIVLSNPKGERFVHNPGEALRIPPPARGNILLDNHPYPGELTLIPRPDRPGEVFDVVTSMGIETYLPGVIAKELYATWPLATFQAQAVCARSYALHERARARRSGRDFDVEATTQDQAFAGATDLNVALDAVRTTRGQVLTWDGQVLRAYYSSTSGGRAASAADVWPTTNGYEFNLAAPLQAAPREYADQDSPAYRWTRERGVARLSLRLRRWGEENGHPIKRIGQITSVSVESRNSVDRPVIYAIRDSRGETFELKAEELRVACNWPVPGVPNIEAKDRVRSGDVTMRVENSKVIIDGRGFGHGVGLCQYSAAALGKQGWPYQQIVLHFYPGAKLERLYP